MAKVQSRRFNIDLNTLGGVARRLDSPDLAGNSARILECLVPVEKLPSNVPDGPDPRSRNENTQVAKEIRDSLLLKDGWFHLKNIGVTILAHRAYYDTETGVLTFTVEDPKLHGILDGAHTYEICLKTVTSDAWEQTPGKGKTQYVKLHILTGAESEGITISEGLNTSVKVQEWSLLNQQGEFDWIQRALDSQGCSYREFVGFEENEGVRENVHYTVLDTLRLLAVINNRIYGPSKEVRAVRQPVDAYSSKGKILKLFNAEKSKFTRLEPFVCDMLEAYEYLKARFPFYYAQSGGRTGGSHTKFLKLTEVARAKTKLPVLQQYCRRHGVNPQDLLEIRDEYFNSDNGWYLTYSVPEGLVYPLLGCLRPFVSDDEVPFWRGRVEGEKHRTHSMLILDQMGPYLVKQILTHSDAQSNNPNAVGKNAAVWEGLYMYAELFMRSLQ